RTVSGRAWPKSLLSAFGQGLGWRRGLAQRTDVALSSEPCLGADLDRRQSLRPSNRPGGTREEIQSQVRRGGRRSVSETLPRRRSFGRISKQVAPILCSLSEATVPDLLDQRRRGRPRAAKLVLSCAYTPRVPIELVGGPTMNVTRRDFLKTSAATGSLVSWGLTGPAFLSRAAVAAPPARTRRAQGTVLGVGGR